MAHWCQFPLWSSGPRAQTGWMHRCGRGEHPTWEPGTTRSRQVPLRRTGSHSVRTESQTLPVGGSGRGRRAKAASCTRPAGRDHASGRPTAPLPLASWVLLPVQDQQPRSRGPPVGGYRERRCGGAAGSEVPLRHLIFLSVFTASSLLNVRVCEVCEREAGDAGRGDGEPGVGRVGPALLGAPGWRRRREVLGGLKGRFRAKKVTCCLGHKRVWGEVIVPFKASTFFIS